MGFHQLANFIDVLVDVFHLRHLDELVDCLLNRRPRVLGHFRVSIRWPVKGK